MIWNLIDGDGNPANNTLTLGNNDNFYGSILAPEFTLNNGNAQVDGQIVAGGLTYGSRELHYTGFDTPQFYDDLPEVPEPSTYGMMGAAGLVGLLVWRRRHQRRLVA